MKTTSLLILSFLFLTSISQAAESDVDRLLELLVEKNVVSADDAAGFRADLAIKKAEEKSDISVPAWVQNIKLKGDARVRYEWDKNKGLTDNSRARVRARLGIEGKANNKVKGAIGIATGKTSDPRSRDATLGNSSTANTPGAGKDIILDYVYGQYTPSSWLTFTAGKFPNILWQPFDVFWDNDITEEGFGININRKLNSKLDFFVNDLFFILKNDSRTDKQPFVNAFQPGFNLAINDQTGLKSAVSYYKFKSTAIKGAQKFSSSNSGGTGYTTSGNSLSGGRYKYEYDAVQPSFELSFKNPLGGLLPFASVFGDYIYNVARAHPGTGRGGFDAGFKFGYDKVSGWSQWQAKVVYSKLGRDAWFDSLTDNNRYAGNTNSKAYEGILEYGLGKNTSLVLDYYYAKSLTKGAARYQPEQIVQVDWNIRF